MSAILLRVWLSAGLWLGPPTDVPAAPEAPAPAPAAPTNEDAPITVTTRLTPDPSHIGDLLTLEVIVAYPRDHSINLPNGLDFAPLELVHVEEGAVESTGNDLRQRFTITLQYFDVGEASVPSFPITWIDPNDEVHTYAVAPHPFTVDSLLANEADPQPRGPDPMISLEYANVRLAEIIVAVVGGVLLAGLIVMAVILLRRRDRPVVVAPPVPAHERAFADLEVLAREREALITAGAYQDYYLRLTEIAKRYLGARFGFEALDRTTEEIQELLGRGAVRIDPLDPKAVIAFLQDCDLVKFARLSPPDEETVEGLKFVRELVERTRPVVAKPPTEQPEGPTEAEPERSAAEGPVFPRSGGSEAQRSAAEGPVFPRSGGSEAQRSAAEGQIAPRASRPERPRPPGVALGDQPNDDREAPP